MNHLNTQFLALVDAMADKPSPELAEFAEAFFFSGASVAASMDQIRAADEVARHIAKTKNKNK
jgi:hypothetical protein